MRPVDLTGPSDPATSPGRGYSVAPAQQDTRWKVPRNGGLSWWDTALTW